MPARGDSGETLALLVLWPMLLVAVLLLLVHAFIVTNAQSEAEVAASAGLRSAWRSAANADFGSEFECVPSGTDPCGVIKYKPEPYNDPTLHSKPHAAVLRMANDAQDAVARAAATEDGWRWWTPDAATVYSDWCSTTADPTDPRRFDVRPEQGESGWVRVTVTGEVFGPLAALWPNRLDRVYAAATGPAVLLSPQGSQQDLSVPVDLPAC